MHSFSIALFAAGALAGNLKLNQILPRELQVRQSEAFQPTTSFGSGATCADAFGSGYIDCNGVCYNPNEDQTCCPGNGDGCESTPYLKPPPFCEVAANYRSTDPCPSESFCLNVGGLCCPDVSQSPYFGTPSVPTQSHIYKYVYAFSSGSRCRHLRSSKRRLPPS